MKIKNIKKKFNITHYTRAQALEKLQIDPKDFRVLCIFRGIHPKMPNKNQIQTIKNKVKCHKDEDKSIHDKQTLLYSVDDIDFLLKDKTLQCLRTRKAHFKKLKNKKFGFDHLKITGLLDRCPQYPFEEIIKDRYPTFEDALKDIDDALNTLFLVTSSTITNLNTDEHKTNVISTEMIKEIKILCFEFMNYVRENRKLEKAYCTTRGMYYQAEINSIEIKWLCPFETNQKTAEDVDLNLLEIYLMFYKNLMQFVNYKLYNDSCLVYPPKFINELYLNNADIDSFELIKKDESKDVDMEETTNDKVEANLLMSEQEFKSTEEKKKTKQMFSNLKIYLSNEIDRTIFKFIITSFGGKVGWDRDLAEKSPFDESDQDITHQLCDRPQIKENAIMGRVYVQPQWILDCINFGQLLPTERYLVGKKLPPHLSPFEKYEAGDYIPEYHKEINNITNNETMDNKNTAQDNIDKIKLNQSLLSNRTTRLLNELNNQNIEKIEKNKKLNEKKNQLTNNLDLDEQDI